MIKFLLGMAAGSIVCGAVVWSFCILQKPWLKTLRAWREIQEAKRDAAADDLRAETLRHINLSEQCVRLRNGNDFNETEERD